MTLKSAGRGHQATDAFTWAGPFRVGELLSRCLEDNQPWPPSTDGVYLVSQHPWTASPSTGCAPLYVGGNTGRSGRARFCTRVGDLLADMHGFWDGGTGHHSGGQSIYKWCKKSRVRPGDLFIAWATRSPWCSRCAELDIISMFVGTWSARTHVGLLNKNRPPACAPHSRRVA